jgi:hypothetical protein
MFRVLDVERVEPFIFWVEACSVTGKDPGEDGTPEIISKKPLLKLTFR